MTWEELKEKAKELGYSGYYDHTYEWVNNGKYYFCENGTIKCQVTVCDTVCGICKDIHDISEKRTPTQMYAIMKALR